MRKVIVAKDIMQSKVVTVSPTTSVAEAWGLLSDNRISGLPVVEDDGTLVGVISQTDILRETFVGDLDAFPPNSYYIGAPFWEIGEVTDVFEKLGRTPVSEAMSGSVLTAEPEDNIASLAVTMRREHIHRLVIVDGGRLVGIVSALDLLSVLEQH